MPSNFKCAICMEEPTRAVVSNCGHLYCWACIDAWANQRQRRVVPCPVCNGAVDIDNETTPIYGVDGNDGASAAHPSQYRTAGNTQPQPQQGANNNNNNNNAYPGQQQQQQQQHRPPPQARRRADPAPPPVNQNPFQNFFPGGGGVGGNFMRNPLRNFGGGFFPFLFFSMGGDMMQTLVSFAVMSFGYYLITNWWNGGGAANNNNQNQQQGQNPIWGIHDRAREYLLMGWQWLKQNWMVILWIVIVFNLWSGFDLFTSSSSSSSSSSGRAPAEDHFSRIRREAGHNDHHGASASSSSKSRQQHQRNPAGSHQQQQPQEPNILFHEGQNHPNQGYLGGNPLFMFADILLRVFFF